MTGLDWRKAPIGLREALSFTRSRVVELDRLLRAAEGVEGCVLLSTCNRTELYLSCASGAEPEPGALLCAAAGLPYAPFAGAFVTRTGEEAAPAPDGGGRAACAPRSGGRIRSSPR